MKCFELHAKEMRMAAFATACIYSLDHSPLSKTRRKNSLLDLERGEILDFSVHGLTKEILVTTDQSEVWC